MRPDLREHRSPHHFLSCLPRLLRWERLQNTGMLSSVALDSARCNGCYGMSICEQFVTNATERTRPWATVLFGFDLDKGGGDSLKVFSALEFKVHCYLCFPN